MDRRYQVFVSSTFADLQDERQEVMQALLELDCIPSGMELFPAANEDQWTLIQKVIDDCDYYMVIVAGRYGSIGPDGASYTEMEYRYAMEVGKPVLGFLHRDPGALRTARCESTDEGKAKLEKFRQLVQKKVCRFWDSPQDLGSQVSRSLVKLIKTNPAVGWVRADLVPDDSATEEILRLRKTIEALQTELQATRTRAPEGTADLAQGDDTFEISFTFVASPTPWSHDGTGYTSSIHVKWDDIFSAVSPLMIHEAKDSDFRKALTALVRDHAWDGLSKRKNLRDLNLMDFGISGDDFQTIKIQFRALGLITQSSKSRSVKDTATYLDVDSLRRHGDDEAESYSKGQ